MKKKLQYTVENRIVERVVSYIPVRIDESNGNRRLIRRFIRAVARIFCVADVKDFKLKKPKQFGIIS